MRSNHVFRLSLGRRFTLYNSMVLVFLLLLSGVAAAASIGPQAILEKIDTSMYLGDSDFSAVMTVISEDPEKGVEKMVIRQFRRDSEGKFLLLFEEPEVQRGQGYLMYEDNLWFYDPSSRKFSHTSLKENLQGTDAKNSDFGESTLADDYTVVGFSEGKLGAYDVVILELEAVNDEVTYPYVKLWVTKEPCLVLKAEEYSLSKRLMRTSLYPNYAKLGDSYIPTRMIFVDELIEGKKTQISITNVSTERLPDSVFTKAYVERVNR